MGKLPGFTFYPGDWMKDPALRSVSLAARGLWIDMLSLMFECDRRGHLTVNDSPVTAEQLARMTGCSTDEATLHLQELENSGVFSRLDNGTIYSRRQVKDERDRQATKERVKKHRCNATVTHDVTPLYVNENEYVKDLSFEVGSKKQSPHLEIEALVPPENSDQLVEQILRLHPANWHWRNSKAKTLQLPFSQCDAVIGAIARDGLDVVLGGVKSYASFVEKQPGFVMKPERFFGTEAHYLKTFEQWESSRGTEQISKAKQRLNNNRAAIYDAVRSRVEQRVGHNGGEQQNGTNTQPDRGDVAKVLKVSAGGD